MTDEQYRLLEWLTYGTYNEIFEVIDDDGVRKPAIVTKIRNVNPSPKGDKNFNKELWTLEIDWRLLDSWRQNPEKQTANRTSVLCGEEDKDEA